MPSARFLTALNADAGTDGPPEWLHLLPPGPDVIGVDGRRWRISDPAAVVGAFNRRSADLVVDWEHATEIRAPQGLDAPGAAWINALEARDDGIWGRVGRWTARAAQQVADSEYRYLSPVFDYDPVSGEIVRLVSAGLTNTPNLFLTALNREEPAAVELSAELLERLRYLFNLPTLAGPAEIKAELEKLIASLGDALGTAANRVGAAQAIATALNRAEAPDLARFVPRADYDAVVSRARNAELWLVERDRAEHEAAIEREIEAALAAGKIVPATVEYHRATCRDGGGLERFRAFVAATPAIADPSGLGARAPALATATCRVPAGFSVDPERTDLLARAREYAAQHGITFAAALAALGE